MAKSDIVHVCVGAERVECAALRVASCVEKAAGGSINSRVMIIGQAFQNPLSSLPGPINSYNAPSRSQNCSCCW